VELIVAENTTANTIKKNVVKHPAESYHDS